jgi:hypothetical protein
MAKRKDPTPSDDLFSAPVARKKDPPTAAPKAKDPPPSVPVAAEPPKRKGKRVWLTNAFELPQGIDRTGLELGPPKAFRSFTVEALDRIGARGLYRIAT